MFESTTGDAVVESVLYKYPSFVERTVICCSSQSGCPVGCRFCGTGDYFVRSLTAEEIAAQPIYLLETQIDCDPQKIDKLQIMFMSMGEPLYNVDNLIKAMEILNEKYPNASLLISTSAPQNPKGFEKIIEVSRRISKIGLQFSVHESTDEARRQLIPSKTMDITDIATTGEAWAYATGRRPYFNYCVHEKNNSIEDVLRLKSNFNPRIWESTLSVICERDENVAAANKRQEELAANFMRLMIENGYSTRMFNPAGQDDVGGGCGQLWYVQDWMKQHPEHAKKSAGCGLPKVHTPRPVCLTVGAS